MWCCLKLNSKYNEKFIRCILGLDPARVDLWMDKDSLIKTGDAHYVQLVHTSYYMGMINRKSADSDIIVGNGKFQIGCWEEPNMMCSHLRSQLIHFLIATKKMAFRASKHISQSEMTYVVDGNIDFVNEATEGCVVGMYNKHVGHGVFYLYVPKEIFRDCNNKTMATLVPSKSINQ